MKKLLLFATCALALFFVSCEKDESKDLTRPTMTIVNGSSYDTYVYFDNSLSAVCCSGGNKKIELDCSINIPVLVVAEFYNSKGSYIGNYIWNDYKFSWNSSYKMTLTDKKGTISKF